MEPLLPSENCTDVMEFAKLEMGIIFLIQTGVGILGNSSLLCFYTFALLTGNKRRPTDLILNQLVLANSLILYSKGIPQTMAAFGTEHFLHAASCKLLFYCHRVASGVSFTTSCLLNGFQAIKLDPSISGWMELKTRSPKFVGLCCFLCWIPHLLINTLIFRIVKGPLQLTNCSSMKNYAYCSWLMPERNAILNTLMYYSTDFMCLIFMVWASGSMVLVLYRHKHRVQHIHRNSLSPRPSHEAKAIRTILILVSLFFSFYSISTTFVVWLTLVGNPGQWRVNSSVLVASCFASFSPFVLLGSDRRISQCCYACFKKETVFCNLVAVL
ncbi:vomeronasal type-1 receptor 1-like [Choloepus didactylus]|uniref:vomeronasal type-1 receptor 1-like n=1 Tax=Choloepus didactylus TaxID=27675 RepID=UPI00189C909D|nr:vomeronasal type-1 receptor 1-like [Choloepus didactylus]